MVGSFKHFHEESVNRRVADQLEEEQVLQALQADGAQCWKSQEQLSKPESGGQKGVSVKLKPSEELKAADC